MNSSAATISLSILATLAIFYVLAIGKALLVPLAIAVLLWYMVNALSRFYANSLLGKNTNWLSMILALITIAVAGVVVVDVIQNNIAEIKSTAPTYKANLDNWMAKLFGVLRVERPPTLNQLTDSIDITTILSGFLSAITAILGSFGLVLIYLGFLLFEQKTFSNKLNRLFENEEKRKDAHNALMQIQQKIETYVWIKTIVSVLTGLVSYIVLKIVGVDFAEFWGFTIFLLNYIPTIGSIIATVFPALLALIQFDTLTPFLIVSLGLISVQFIVGNVVEPKLMGNTLNLSPLVMLLSLALWGSLWGVAGMFLCVPIMVMLVIILSHFEMTRPIAILLSARGELTGSSA